MAQADPQTGQLRRVNDKMCAITGYSRVELLGKRFSEFTHPDDRQKDWEAFQRVMRGEASDYHLDKRYICKDGRLAWVHVSVTVMRNEAGQPIHSMAAIEDITDRKRVELQLNRINESLLGLTYDSEKNINTLTALCGELLTGDCALYSKLEGSKLCVKGHWQAPPDMPLEDNAQGHICTDVIQGSKLGPTVIRHLQETPYAQTDPNVRPAGLHTYVGHPVTFGGVTIGSLCAVFTRDMEPTEDELRILGILAAAIGQEEERRQAQDSVRASQQLVEGVLNAIPVRVFWKDKNLAYLGCNENFARDAGFTNPSDLIGKEDSQMSWRDQAELYRSDDLEVINTNRAKLNIEEPQTLPDGKMSILLTSKLPLRDAAGNCIGVLGTHVDITDRKQAEDAHARLATAVEQAAESIVITDTRGKILYVNPAFEKVTGYTAAEAQGQNPRILKSGLQDAEFYRRMWNVLRQGEVWSGHFSNQRKDGTCFEEEATISPIRDTRGNIINYVAVKRDVTREKQLESQFRQSQKMEAFGQLAGGVAHDFNNILGIIMMQAGLLRTLAPDLPEVTNMATDISRAAERGANLTRQLLLFSRRQTLQPRDLDANEIVTSITKMLRRIVGEDVRMQLKFAAHPAWVHADAGMLDQVLMNLTVNSRDAMPEGGDLLIETSIVDLDEFAAQQSPRARPGAFVCLSVSDTGGGIPAHILPRIFEPFFTTKEVGKGTGLGLATVFGIVQQHDGWVDVYSEPGLGTTFRVYLPRLTRDVDPKALAPEEQPLSSGNETILLVEDESELRSVVVRSLSKLGYRVLEAANGREALDLWERHASEIRLLLTDMVMPGGMNGKELAKQLQQANPALKFIYASGYSVEVAGKDLELHDGVNFLAKPFVMHKLAEILRNQLA
jgi:PAS domain S-box-containing protein